MIILDTNIANGATSQYRGFSPLSMAKSADQKFFIGCTDGLYLYDDKLNTEEISSYFKTGWLDFGNGMEKSLRYVRISLRASGELDLSIKTDINAEQVYPVIVHPVPSEHEITIPVSSHQTGHYFMFTVSNDRTKADFSIYKMSALVLQRSVSRILR